MAEPWDKCPHVSRARQAGPSRPGPTKPASDWATNPWHQDGNPHPHQPLPHPLEKGTSPTNWRLQALGKLGFIHQLIPRKVWRRAWRLGWAQGQLVSKLVPGAAPRLRMEGCPGLRASTEQLSPWSPGQRPHSSRSHRELPGNRTSSPESTPPKFLGLFSPVNRASIYRHGNMRGEGTGRKYTTWYRVFLLFLVGTALPIPG